MLAYPAPKMTLKHIPFDLMRQILTLVPSWSVIQLWLSGDSHLRLMIGPYGAVTDMCLSDLAPLSKSRWPMILSQMRGLTSLRISRGLCTLQSPSVIREELSKLSNLRILHIKGDNSCKIMLRDPREQPEEILKTIAAFFPKLDSLAINDLPSVTSLRLLPETLKDLTLDSNSAMFFSELDFPPSLTSLDLSKVRLPRPTSSFTHIIAGNFIELKLVKLSMVLDDMIPISALPETLLELKVVLKCSFLTRANTYPYRLPSSLQVIDVTPPPTGGLGFHYRHLSNLKKLIIRNSVYTEYWPVWLGETPIFPVSLTELSLTWQYTSRCPIILPPCLKYLSIEITSSVKSGELEVWTENDSSNFHEISKKFMESRDPSRRDPIHIGTLSNMLHPNLFATKGYPASVSSFELRLRKAKTKFENHFEMPSNWIASHLVTLNVLHCQVPKDFIQTLHTATRLKSLEISIELESFPTNFCPNLTHLSLCTTTARAPVIASIPRSLVSLHLLVEYVELANLIQHESSTDSIPDSMASSSSTESDTRCLAISSYQSSSHRGESTSIFDFFPSLHLKSLKWDLVGELAKPQLDEAEWRGLERFKELETLDIDFGFSPRSLMSHGDPIACEGESSHQPLNPFAFLPRSLTKLSLNGPSQFLPSSAIYFEFLPPRMTHLRLLADRILNMEAECAMLPRNLRRLLLPKTVNTSLQALYNLPLTLDTLVIYYEGGFKGMYDLRKILSKREKENAEGNQPSRSKSIFATISSFFSGNDPHKI
jgi:hypothetical protein